MTVRDRPVVSVCIANYNGGNMLEECLESVFAQRFSGVLEVIVHDDASTDGSEELTTAYPETILIRSHQNVGYCISNNRMVKAATGDYVLLFNNDAVLLPDAVQTLLSAAQDAPDAGICSLPQYDHETGNLIDCGMTLDPFLNPVPVMPSTGATPVMAIGACLFIKKSLWETIGGFPAWYDSIAEDMYLCLYARLLGYNVSVAHNSGFRHRIGQSFGGGKTTPQGIASTYRRRQLSERNKTFNMILFYPTPALALILPLHLLLLIVEGLALSAQLRTTKPLSLIYCAAVVSALDQRRHLWRLRAKIQASAQTDTKSFFRAFTRCPHKLTMLWRHGWPSLA